MWQVQRHILNLKGISLIKFLRNSVIVLYSLCTASILHSCEKKEVPTVATYEVTTITATTATCGGTITDEGSGTIISRGVCWGQGITPTIVNHITTDGTGAGTFISNMSNL